MNLIYLGLLFDSESLREAGRDSKIGLQMAPHTFQTNLITGLQKQQNVELHVINVLPVGSWPIHYKSVMIHANEWDRNGYRMGELNLPVVKHMLLAKYLERELERRIQADGESAVLIYSLYQPFICAAYRCKKRHPNIKVCLIQTDAVHGRNSAKKYDNYFNIRQEDQLIKLCGSFDSFVILTKYLAEPLEINDRPHIVMEGICDAAQALNVREKGGRNICLYTGALDREYHICELVDAFQSLSDAELWICGDGDAAAYIKRAADESARIKFFGFLGRDELRALRDACDFFINPRVPTGNYTLYSFPSKTMEYMMAGKPTIMYKLEGIPDEYDPYLIYLDADTAFDTMKLKENLQRIFASDYEAYVQKAAKGREFVQENKSPAKQAGRIVELIRSTRV